MIVFVTGASSTLGGPTVRALREAGHTVRALVRSPKSAGPLRETGAEIVEGNLFKQETWRSALDGADAVMHLATHIPAPRKARRKLAWSTNDRIRTEGTRLLVNASHVAGVERLIYPSVTMVYGDGGSEKLAAGSEGTREQATWILKSTLEAEHEVARFTELGGIGIALRLGNLYGRHTGDPDPVIATARRGVSAFVGRPEAYQALIWDEDAARALVAALHAPAGLYDVVDDEPLTRQELAEVLSQVMGRPIKLVPVWFSRGLLRAGAAHMLRSQRVSNAAYVAATGWHPAVPSAREGLPLLARRS
jgi:nucleoside-diphosphate-sugar epimerase